VKDAKCDLRTTVNPGLVVVSYIRFYAGTVMRSREGHALGTLLIVDRKPRDFTEVEGKLLQTLARQAVQMIENRAMTGRGMRRPRAIDSCPRRDEYWGTRSR
jgi:GAF domain-containing protein